MAELSENLESCSQIPLSERKARLHNFHCSQNCVYPMYQNAYHHLPSLYNCGVSTVLTVLFHVLVSAQTVRITHWCLIFAEQWLCAQGQPRLFRREETKLWWQRAGSSHGRILLVCKCPVGHGLDVSARVLVTFINRVYAPVFIRRCAVWPSTYLSQSLSRKGSFPRLILSDTHLFSSLVRIYAVSGVCFSWGTFSK